MHPTSGPSGSGDPSPAPTVDDPAPLLPDYGGACISSLAPALLQVAGLTGEGAGDPPAWLPGPARAARQVVLLVLDGLGWLQLHERAEFAPSLSAMSGGPITSVAPTTTSTALTSIATGLPPAAHGILGYRMHVGAGDVLNVLRWRTAAGDARQSHVPEDLQRAPSFGGHPVPYVSPAYFIGSGFSRAYLQGAAQVGWRVASSLRVEVARLVGEGAPLVVAYYDGIDVVAHAHGLGEHYEAELATADRIVGDLLSDLPDGCVLVVTADHGQVEVESDPIVIDPAILADVELMSGEGRFRWLHARAGAAADVAAATAERYGASAWVRTREEVVAEGWFGGEPSAEAIGRIGDVAVAARGDVAFFDPADTGEHRLICRHGSLTPAEMQVPLLAWAP